MLKRLIKVIGTPVMMIVTCFEMIIYGARWIWTGKEFPEKPLIDKFLFDW